jgi:hypothetical protein
VIGSVATKGSFGYGSQTGAKAEVKSAPKSAPQPAAREPSPVLGRGGGTKPGQTGGTGTQGPAPGIQSPTKVQTQPKGQARNLRANMDGSISYAAGARIDSKVMITQKTAEPATPLKSRAQAMIGSNVDARG